MNKQKHDGPLNLRYICACDEDTPAEKCVPCQQQQKILHKHSFSLD